MARLLRGPLFVGESYTTEREVVFLSGSKRTESMWVRTTVFGADGAAVATMLLNLSSSRMRSMTKNMRNCTGRRVRENEAFSRRHSTSAIG